ncbi:3-oxoadipate enol-lactonase [Saccharopolyspora sp. HNM0983]|uniref:3-oxoadipate enol-lactonase n=1 Tax=Saccharopolyspora montiporae TaxID=2781240 RepID=A0A929BCG1_9PSEU|nr:3-oxoadipate enol-lactonase [Saccharopolyspora sp. HNM0983]
MNLNYELTGPQDAPVVVLSNSLGTDLSLWDEQVPALQRHFRVLRYDQRGHGASPSAPGPFTLEQLGGDVLQLLDQLGIARAHFAGVSLGGMTGMWLAENAPDRIAGLALICTSAALGPPSMWTERAAVVREQGMAAMVEPSLPKWFTPELAQDPEVAAKFGGMIRACDPEGYAGCCEAIAEMDLLDGLGRISAPTLVIAGAEDPATPPAHAEQIAAGVPGARVEVLSPAAHLANAEQPAAVNRLLLQHFTAGDDDSRREQGMRTRRQVLGDEHVDRATAKITSFTEGFQDFITRYAWGELWSSDAVPRETRSMLTLAILAARGLDDEFAMHVRAARRNGVEAEEIREVLMHVAVYAGVPRANAAFGIADRILSAESEQDAD